MASLNDSSEITLGLLQIPPAISFDKGQWMIPMNRKPLKNNSTHGSNRRSANITFYFGLHQSRSVRGRPSQRDAAVVGAASRAQHRRRLPQRSVPRARRSARSCDRTPGGVAVQEPDDPEVSRNAALAGL